MGVSRPHSRPARGALRWRLQPPAAVCHAGSCVCDTVSASRMPSGETSRTQESTRLSLKMRARPVRKSQFRFSFVAAALGCVFCGLKKFGLYARRENATPHCRPHRVDDHVGQASPLDALFAVDHRQEAHPSPRNCPPESANSPTQRYWRDLVQRLRRPSRLPTLQRGSSMDTLASRRPGNQRAPFSPSRRLGRAVQVSMSVSGEWMPWSRVEGAVA